MKFSFNITSIIASSLILSKKFDTIQSFSNVQLPKNDRHCHKSTSRCSNSVALQSTLEKSHESSYKLLQDLSSDFLAQVSKKAVSAETGNNIWDQSLTLLKKCGDDGREEGAELAGKILRGLQNEAENSVTNKHYAAVINAYGKCGKADKAAQVFDELADNTRLTPDLACYRALLNAHARNHQIEKAFAVLKQMESESLSPTAADYNSVLSGYCEKGQIKKAEALLKHMDDRSKTNPECKPSFSTLNLLLDSYTQSSSSDSIIKANNLLNSLIELMKNNDSEDDGHRARMTLVHNKVLTGLKNSDSPDAISQAEALIQKMEAETLVNHVSYTAFIGILANKGDTSSARRANEIAEFMLKAYQQGDSNLKPNSQTWNSVINAWVKSGNVKRAESILTRMEIFRSEGSYDMSPNVITYSTVMDGWAKSKENDSLSKTEGIFNRMQTMYEEGNQDAKPNIWTYVKLVDAYTRHSNPDALQKAENIVKSLYEQYQSGQSSLKPNTQLVTMIITAWKKSGSHDAGEKAEALLDWLISVYGKEKDLEIAPNEFTFSSTIAAWANSRKFGKAIRARSVLNKMTQAYKGGLKSACPNTVCYTAVINACAYCEDDPIEKRDALKIAIATYKDLEKSEIAFANSATYTNILTAIRNLLDACPQRDAAVKAIFKDACEDGCVDHMVLKRLKSVIGLEEVQKLVPPGVFHKGNVLASALPEAWTRNCK